MHFLNLQNFNHTNAIQDLDFETSGESVKVFFYKISVNALVSDTDLNS